MPRHDSHRLFLSLSPVAHLQYVRRRASLFSVHRGQCRLRGRQRAPHCPVLAATPRLRTRDRGHRYPLPASAASTASSRAPTATILCSRLGPLFVTRFPNRRLPGVGGGQVPGGDAIHRVRRPQVPGARRLGGRQPAVITAQRPELDPLPGPVVAASFPPLDLTLPRAFGFVSRPASAFTSASVPAAIRGYFALPKKNIAPIVPAESDNAPARVLRRGMFCRCEDAIRCLSPVRRSTTLLRRVIDLRPERLAPPLQRQHADDTPPPLTTPPQKPHPLPPPILLLTFRATTRLSPHHLGLQRRPSVLVGSPDLADSAAPR